MKTRAVIFDLYGTLVRETTQRAMFESVRHMAKQVGADPIAFASAWFTHGSHGPRDRALPWIESNLEAVCASLCVELTPERRRQLNLAREALINQTLLPRQGALRTLAKLRSRGLLTAVVGDTPPDVPAVFGKTDMARHLNVTMLACSDTCRHDEPRIMAELTRELGVPAQKCIYVSRYGIASLDAADAFGMQTVLLCDEGQAPVVADLPFVTKRYESLLEVFWLAADCMPGAAV